jgi:hypothetical protein
MHTRILVAVALAFASPALLAYQIVEGRYRVETSPGVFEDQLVVRCDDGRTLTVPWETKLAETCGEGLMGERVGKPGKAPTAATAETAAVTPEGSPAAATAPAAAQPGSLFDESAQRDAMLAQIRAQFGDIPERYIEFKPGPDGLSMRLLPPLNEIVKKYEACRRAREPGSQCAAMRDQAIAKLAEAPAAPELAAAPGAAVPRTKPGKNAAPKAAAKGDAPMAKSESPAAVAAEAPIQAQPLSREAGAVEPAGAGVTPAAEAGPGSTQTSAKADPQPAMPASADRAGMEQKIAQEHAVCMRLKPRFECEQARARALGTLDRPKAAKPARPAKQAGKSARSQIAAAPGQ